MPDNADTFALKSRHWLDRAAEGLRHVRVDDYTSQDVQAAAAIGRGYADLAALAAGLDDTLRSASKPGAKVADHPETPSSQALPIEEQTHGRSDHDTDPSTIATHRGASRA